MKRVLSLCVCAFLTIMSFSQYSIELEKHVADNGEPYFQGELSLNSYVDDAENGFLPTLNTAYAVEFKNLTSNTTIGRLQVNLVDRAEAHNWWVEVNPVYKMLGENITPDGAITTETNIYVKNLESPEEGKYTLIFHAWGVYEDVSPIMLNIEELSMATLVDMYLEETSLELSVGETSDVKSLILYSKFEATETDEYPSFVSSNSEIASVDENGVVTAVAPGTATITVSSLGKLLTDVEEYEAGAMLVRENELQVTVSRTPNVVFTWNTYGTDLEGVGEEGVSDYWQYSNSEKIPAALNDYEAELSSTWKASKGDSFTIHIKGLSNATGILDLVLVDQRKEVSNWGEMTDFVRSLAITKDEEFDITETLEIKYLRNEQGTLFGMPDVILEFSPSNGSEYGKENNVEFSLSEFEVSFTPPTVVEDIPSAAFAEKSYTVELGETIEIVPQYEIIDNFANLSFVLKQYNGSSSFQTNTENASCNVTGVKVGVDSLVMNLTYSDGNETYRFTDTCEIVVVPSSKVGVPTVAKTNYEYCQMAEATDIVADITPAEGATLKWYEQKDGVYTEYYGTTTPNTSYVHETQLAVSQVVDGLEGAKVPISVVIKEKPAVSCDVPESATEGDAITLSAFVGNFESLPDCSFEWFVNGTSVSQESSKVVTLEVGEHNVTLITTATNGCSDTQIREIFVGSAVETPTVATTSYEYCLGDDAEQLSAVASENASLSWYNGKEKLEGAPTPSTEIAGTYIYNVSQFIDGKESARIPITVVVNPLPEVSIAPSVAAIYQQTSCEFTATSETECSYEWFMGESSFAKGAAASKTFYGTGTFLISVVAQSDNGCVNTAQKSLKVKKVPSISFAQRAVSIYEGESVELIPQLADFEPTENPVWSVDKDAVASVENGVVSAKSEGKAVVTYSVKYADAETEIEKTYSASCTVTVKKNIEEIVAEHQEYEMIEGEHMVVDAIVHSETASSSYHVECSNPDMAEITDKMLVALAPGDVQVYVIADDNNLLKDTMYLHIKPFIPAKDVSMPKQITIKVGADTTLSATVVPSNASYTDVEFMEKDDDYISVQADGRIFGKSVGTSIVTASTREGVQAQTLVYVTSSQEEIVKIQVPDTVYLKNGETVTIPCKVAPTTIKANDLHWTILDGDVADVTHSGVLTGKKAGATILTVSYGSKIGYVVVYVTNSVAPTINLIPTISLQQPDGVAKICLKNYIFDDNSKYENLQIELSENEYISTKIDGDTAVFSLKDAEFIGSTKVKLTVTEFEKVGAEEVKLTSSRVVDVNVIEKPNAAPEIVMNAITVPFGKYTQVVIADMATDDYTPSAELGFNYEEGENLLVKKVKNTALRIYPLEDDWSGEDVITVWFTDAQGLETEAAITVTVQASENQAPVIGEIPQQYENDTMLFTYIDLSQYVTDDYTSPSSIFWSASTSENVSVKITGSIAEISSLNEYWRGAEVVTFTAMDQGGLTTSADVTFFRETKTSLEEQDFGWYGKPQVSIYTSRYYGTPGETITLIGTFYGTNCSALWEVEGLELENPNDLIQYLTFDATGYYDVTFTVMYGADETLAKNAEIAMYGNIERKPAICIGESVELEATTDVDSYLWSTGETAKSITVNPLETTRYYLTMKKGLATLVDTVDVRVSVPVSLPADSVMCAGTTFELSAEFDEYVSYSWNTGDATPSIKIPAAVAEYSVSTVDDLGCESSATFNITKVNELPPLDLGGDRTVCDKQILKLDAGAGYVYDWNVKKYNDELVSSDEQFFSLDSSAYVTVKITDNNFCESFDTVNVTFTYPFKEEIGVVTYSETSKNIIVAWERTADVNTKNYRVERLITNDVWEQVGEPVLFEDFGIVVDEATNYEQRAYKYRLVTTDGCNNEAQSGIYRSSFLQKPDKVDGTIALHWWTYQSPREGNVKGCYLWRIPADGVTDDGSRYETLASFDTEDDYIGWTDVEGKFQKGDMIRVAFELDKPVYENAVNDKDGNLIERQENKAESGPFSIAISNIAEVENETSDGIDAIAFPADVAVYPTVVTDKIHVAIASQTYNNYIVEVFSADGQRVACTQTGDVAKALVDIPANSFTQGIYTVKISVGDLSKSIKVIK
ncbi:MAG: Ig-like domain-containing protein [Bacteroidales bacterium]|nr:Ig-like domain-containing protein [Bacteroidales bacterium]